MTAIESKQALARIMQIPANKKCVDCTAPNPQWASAKFGCFFCLECSGLHRGLGTHIDFVRSVDMDTWKPSEVRVMEIGGNDALLKFFQSKGIAQRQISEKYITHDALLYKERLRCSAEGAYYDEAAALRSIIAMEQEIEARKLRLSSMKSASNTSVGDNNQNRNEQSVSGFGWTVTKGSSDALSRAWSTTSTVSKSIQVQASPLIDSARTRASQYAESTKTFVLQSVQSPASEQAAQNQQGYLPAIQKMKEMSGTGVSVLSSYATSAASVLQNTWASVVTSPQTNNTQTTDESESNTTRKNAGNDLDDFLNTNNSYQDPTDLSDLFGTKATIGGNNNDNNNNNFNDYGNKNSYNDNNYGNNNNKSKNNSGLDDLFGQSNENSNDLSDLFPKREVDYDFGHTSSNISSTLDNSLTNKNSLLGYDFDQSSNNNNDTFYNSSSPVQQQQQQQQKQPSIQSQLDWAWEGPETTPNVVAKSPKKNLNSSPVITQNQNQTQTQTRPQTDLSWIEDWEANPKR